MLIYELLTGGPPQVRVVSFEQISAAACRTASAATRPTAAKERTGGAMRPAPSRPPLRKRSCRYKKNGQF